MTLDEVKDKFLLEYRLEVNKRGVKEFIFNNREIASWIAETQQEIVDRLNLITTHIDLALTSVTAFTTYDLPVNFGKLLKAEINGNRLNIIGFDDIQTTGTIPQGTPDSIAVYRDNDDKFKAVLQPLASTTATCKVWYVVNTLFYSPSGVSAQNWGTFDGTSFSGNLKMPERYIPLLLIGVLGRIFPDKQQEYEAKLRMAKNNKSTTTKRGIKYNLGGYPADRY